MPKTFSEAIKIKDNVTADQLKDLIKVIRGASEELTTDTIAVSSSDKTKLVIALANSVTFTKGPADCKVTIADNALTDLAGNVFAGTETDTDTDTSTITDVTPPALASKRLFFRYFLLFSHLFFRGSLFQRLAFTFFFIFIAGSQAFSFIPERRRAQYNTELAYLVLPTAVNVPGIGSALVLLGYGANVYKEVDVLAALTTGDLDSYTLGLGDIKLSGNTLIFDTFHSGFSKASIQRFLERGTTQDNDKDNKIFASLDSGQLTYLRLSSEFWERRLRFEYTASTNSSRIVSLFDKEGTEIGSADKDASEQSASGSALAFFLDITDDYRDPRIGSRLILKQVESSNRTISSTSYLPIPFNSDHTLAINFAFSEALDTGSTKTRAEFIRDLGIDCSTFTDTAQCNKFIDNSYAAETLGLAESLGGRSRLRSYPVDRFQGSLMKFAGVEYRYNFSTLQSLIDWYVFRDIRTAMQLAFFHEVGSIADSYGELHDSKNYRSSTGIGFRLVASGFVYRFDLAAGDEGSQPILIIEYPW